MWQRLFGPPRLRGFRGRSDTSHINLMAAGLGIMTGCYIFGEPLRSVMADYEVKPSPPGMTPEGGRSEAGGDSSQQ